MATSLVSAVINLYNSISAGTFGGTERPPIFLGEAAQTKADTSQQRPPYVVLYDDTGFRPEQFSGTVEVDTGTIRLEVFALLLDDTSGVTVDSIVRAVKWGGFPPSNKAGFDWGTLTFATGSYLYQISLRRTLEQRSYAGFLDKDGKRVHKCRLLYECKYGQLAS